MQLQNATILLVDDEPDLLFIMEEWFRREGSRVLTAENGARALEAIRTNQVDAVVSDIRMPVMDGGTMLRSIKSTHTYKPSVMFISCFSDIEPREAYDLGVEATMEKPVERKELVAAVRRVLEGREEQWSVPPSQERHALLEAAFESVATALREGLLAFGRGGFCIHSNLELGEGPVDLLLDFRQDHRRVRGQGIVRWSAPGEAQIGVEITHIDDANRSWVLDLTSSNEILSFIPRTTAAGITATMKAAR